MEFKHVRGNVLILFDKVTQLPLLGAVVIAGLFIAKNFDPEILISVLFLALSPLWGIAKYVSTYYTIEEGHLIVETGIVNKKRMEIPLRAITTVDLSQNILYQLFKTYRIKVDNASQTNDTMDKAEVRLALKADRAFEFRRMLAQNAVSETSEAENIHEIRASLQEFIKLGLLQSKIMFFFAGGPIAVPVIGAAAALATGSKNFNELMDRMFEGTSAGIAVFALAAFFYLVALGISLIKSLFTYYNFKIVGSTDTIKIEYGLLNKKKFTLQKGRINGVLLKQNLLMRAFKYYTAEILVIGYGDSSDDDVQEQAILYPVASREEIESITNKLLPEFQLKYTMQGPDRKAKRYFFYRPGFITALLIFITALFVKNVIFIALAGGILVIAAISVLLQYLNAGIFCGENNVILSSGGYRKTVAIIKTAGIESITAKGSISKRKKGIVSIKLGFVAPLRAANITALNLPAEQYKILEKVIKY